MRTIHFAGLAALVCVAAPLFGLARAVCGETQVAPPTWTGYAGNAQHTALSNVAAQALDTILWQTPVDLMPQYNGSDLYIHYAEPMVTAANTILIPVKTGAAEGFRVDARSGVDGAPIWSLTTDFVLPPNGDWTPSFPASLTPAGRLYFAGGGGTVYYVDNPDEPNATVSGQFAFYGWANYQANAALYNANVFIDSPITADASGAIYFGFYVTNGAVPGLSSGIARIAPDGTALSVSAQAAASGDPSISKTVYNCAPALSNDGAALYMAVGSANSFGSGRLVLLDAGTLTTISSVALIDPDGEPALLPDEGTASPVVGPDGDVYFGVLENPFLSNNDRGWLLHFSSELSVQKATGSFGWDDTPSVVPAVLVPAYTGTSSYLLATKYNDYADFGIGHGNNKLAVLDPNATQVDANTGHTVMLEVQTILGVTPDPNFTATDPNAVREWCINSAAVDPGTGSVYAGSEDGKLYKWNLASNSFAQVVTLTPGIGEAYTPTLIGPTGTVYAINNATLFAVGSPLPSFRNGALPPTTASGPESTGAAYAFTFISAGLPAPTFAVTSGALPNGLALNSATGAVTGTATDAGVFTGTLTASNSAGSATQDFSITVNPPLSVDPNALAPTTAGSATRQTLTVSNGTVPYANVAVSGFDPGTTGLTAAVVTVDPVGNTVALNATPPAAGSATFVVNVTDAVGAVLALSFTLIVNVPIMLTPATVANGTVYTPYSQSVSAAGGTGAKTFAVASGTLPPGLNVNATTGEIAGIPTAVGAYQFTIGATDAVLSTSRQAYTVSIAAPTILVSPATLPGALFGAAYSQTLTASGGKAPYTFVVNGGTLPPGLSLGVDGSLGGTPTQEGTFAFSVAATDASTDQVPYVGSLSYSIAVDRIPVFVSAPAANPNPAIVNLAVEFSTAVDLPDAVSSWDFGDGAPVSSGLAVEHIYVTEGDFQVVVTARNPRTQAAAMATLSLNVGHTAVLPDTLATRQTHGLIKFATTGEDRATVTSMLQLPGRLSVKGTTLILGIGGLARTFVFGASGNAVLADASAHVRIVGQTKSGAIARVSVKLSGALKAAITSGAALDAQGLPLKTPLAIDLGGTAFSDIVSLNFKKARGGVQAKY